MLRILQDLRYATRGLIKTPLFTVGVLLTLGLGIGINATMFGVVDTLFLKPPAGVVDPGSVVRLNYRQKYQTEVYTQAGASFPTFLDLQKGAPQFQSLAAMTTRTMSLGRGADAREVGVAGVSHEYFPLVGVHAVLGRLFTAAEDRVGGDQVAVISYHYWQTHFNGRADVIGKVLPLGKQGYTVIGVAQKNFSGIDIKAADVFLPIRPAANGDLNVPQSLTSHGYYWLEIIGRLRPSVSRATVVAAATQAFRTGQSADREVDTTTEVVLGPIQEARGPETSSDAKVALWIGVVAAAVLLIACANVTNLLLARGVSRRRELAVRASLGAGRGGLMRALLSESLVLAVAGGAAAVVLAVWGGAAARTFLLPDLSSDTALIEPRMLAFTGAAILLVTLLIGLVPAIQSSGNDLVTALKSSSRGATSQGRMTRTILLVAQIALTVTLLVGAGLFVRSLRAVQGIDPGFDADRVYTVTMGMEQVGMSRDDANATYLRLVDRYRQFGGVEAAAASMGSPFRSSWANSLRMEGLDSLPRTTGGGPYVQAITDDYFRTLGIKIPAGREFGPGDRAGSAPVAIIGATLAKRAWPATSPIGKCLYVGDDSVTTCTRIVGVATDAKRGRVTEKEAFIYYLPMLQFHEPTISSVFVRARPGAGSLVPALQREINASGNLPFARIETLADQIAPQLRSWRLGATAFACFGLLALTIAALGVFSVLSYSVSQRTREIGVRVALGAQSGQVVRMIVWQGLSAAAIGLAVGAVGAFALGHAIASLLYQVKPTDPLVLGSVAVVLVIVATLAAYLPARRATQVLPTVALRAE